MISLLGQSVCLEQNIYIVRSLKTVLIEVIVWLLTQYKIKLKYPDL